MILPTRKKDRIGLLGSDPLSGETDFFVIERRICMKRNYENPQIEWILLLEEDVIRTSDETETDVPEVETDSNGNAWSPWV